MTVTSSLSDVELDTILAIGRNEQSGRILNYELAELVRGYRDSLRSNPIPDSGERVDREALKRVHRKLSEEGGGTWGAYMMIEIAAAYGDLEVVSDEALSCLKPAPASVEVTGEVEQVAAAIWNDHLYHADAIVYGDKMITPDMATATAIARTALAALAAAPASPTAVQITDEREHIGWAVQRSDGSWDIKAGKEMPTGIRLTLLKPVFVITAALEHRGA